MRWIPTRFESERRIAKAAKLGRRRPPLTAPRRSAARSTPHWSRRAACERRPLRALRCAPKRW